jgi:hypothetical protein
MQRIKALILFFGFSLFTFHFSLAQPSPFKLFLVGDAGEDELTGETLDSLKSELLGNPNSGVVFLGDNTYKKILLGLTEGFKGFDSSKVAQKKMLSQLSILNGYKGSAYFVPGNHDWWNLTNFNKGKRGLKMEESFIEANLAKNKTIANPDATFFPKNGNPGPATAELNRGKVKIIFIDTDWLILLGFKKTTPKANYDFEPVFYHRLDSTIASSVAAKQTVIVVAHHPVYATGKVLALKVKHPYLFPRVKQSFRDFPAAKAMAEKLEAIFEKYPGIYYACGHIHALQYHYHNNVHYLISGAGSKTNKIKKKEAEAAKCTNQDCELWNQQGFFEIDFFADHNDIYMYKEFGKTRTKL